METVILLNASKTKNGVTVLTYAYKDPSEKYKKGYSVRTQFLDVVDLYDKLSSQDFGEPFGAEFGYQDTYDGQARKIITTLYDDNGEIVFAL